MENALLTFLRESDENVSTFAVRIGRSPSTLTRALSGDRNPSVELAKDVERGTNGVVSAGAFIDICIAAKSAGKTRSQDADSVTSGPDAADLKASGPVLSHEAAA